jgi:hypothetical protein
LDRVLGDFPALRVVPAHGNWPWVALPSLLVSTAARLLCSAATEGDETFLQCVILYKKPTSRGLL